MMYALYTTLSSKWWHGNQVTLMAGCSPLSLCLSLCLLLSLPQPSSPSFANDHKFSMLIEDFLQKASDSLGVIWNFLKVINWHLFLSLGRQKGHTFLYICIYIYEPPLLPAQWVMAVVNAREWMEEPLLKASIDPFPGPKESKGLNVAQGFWGRHKGADMQVPQNKDSVLHYCKTVLLWEKVWQTFSFWKSLGSSLWKELLCCFFKLNWLRFKSHLSYTACWDMLQDKLDSRFQANLMRSNFLSTSVIKLHVLNHLITSTHLSSQYHLILKS